MSEDLVTEVTEVTDVAEVIEVTEESIAEPGQEVDPVSALTTDLKRERAEFLNYKRYQERERLLTHERAIRSVLNELLPVLDDIDGAKSHGELTGGFKAVADRIASATERIGLTKFGTEGELFDPNIHEALQSDTSPDVTAPTATKILQSGYKFKEHILRPARVAVTEPEETPAAE